MCAQPVTLPSPALRSSDQGMTLSSLLAPPSPRAFFPLEQSKPKRPQPARSDDEPSTESRSP